MRCQKLMVCVILGVGAMAWAQDREAATRVVPLKGAVAVQGLEQLPAEAQVQILAAIRELGPRIVEQSQRQQGQIEGAPVTKPVFLTGHERLWLSDPDVAQFLEDVAFDAVVNDADFSDGGLSMRETEDGLSFRIDTADGIHIIQMTRKDDKLAMTFAAVQPWATGDGTDGLRIQMINGKIQVEQVRQRWEDRPEQVETAATGGVADASGDGCASTPDGVCCSFTNGASVRVVCMCRVSRSNGQTVTTQYVLCGDTQWLH